MSAHVLIVDDQSLFREGLVALLSGEPGIGSVRQVKSGPEALAACQQSLPDVVLMDMQMPGMDGPTTTHELLRRWPRLRVLALTTFDDDATVFAALRAGAAGYVLKDLDRHRLLEAILDTARGQSVVQPSVLPKVLGEFQRLSDQAPASGPAPHGLSERELSVLRALMQGLSNKEIAQQLHLAEGTVKNHVTNIFEKLGVTDRTSAALRGRELGIARK